jgi:hypothetical protein
MIEENTVSKANAYLRSKITVFLFAAALLVAACGSPEQPAEAEPAATAPAAPAAPAYIAQPAVFKTDSRDIVLAPGGDIEIKYHLRRGATMLYSWKATAVVPFEFHGEPDVKPNPQYYESHEKDDAGKMESHGTFVSTSTGLHGWYWKNPTDREVTVHLVTAGYFDGAKEFSKAGQKDLEIQDAE